MNRTLLVLVLLILTEIVVAQSTMMNEISYPLLERLVNLAKENYPKAKSFERQVAISKINLKSSKLSWFDLVNFAYMRNRNLSATNTNAYLLNGYQYGLNFNVGSLLQKSTQVKTAKEQLDIAYLEKEEYNLLLAQTVKERYFTYIQQVTNLKIYMKAAQDAENILQLVTSRFEKGEETFENYNAAVASVNNANQNRINNEAQVLIAKSNLEAVIGTKLEALDYWSSDTIKQ
jgi:outer membrane protein TolC